MVSSREFAVPAAAALTCLIAVGCSGDNDNNNGPLARLPNKPPIIVKDSLTWSPPHAQIQKGLEYKFSVRAIDPNVGDKVVGYSWRFGDGTFYDTSGPTSEPHAFIGPDAVCSVSVMAHDNRGAIGPEVTFSDLPMSLNSIPIITIIGMPANNVAAAEVLQYLSFKITDADNDEVAWAINWGDGTEEDVGNATNTVSGAIIQAEHTFAMTFVGQTLTVTIKASDQKSFCILPFELHITN